jgi:hypothetical protein
MGVNAVPEDITTGEEITEGVDGSTPDSVEISQKDKFEA